MWPIANMCWRIGDILDIHEQIAWTRSNGFDGVAFHASAGAPGGWQGVDPSATDAAARAALKREIAVFTLREIHAPFEIKLSPDDPSEALERLWPIVDFAGDVGAGILTVHGALPAGDDAAAERWRDAMVRLNDRAAGRGVVIGLEILEQFEQLAGWQLANIAVTLDVGHMAASEALFAEYGSLGAVARRLGSSLAHLHVHDIVDGVDHCEVGRGRLDFDSLLTALCEIEYAGGMALEMNPGRVDPAGIVRSRDVLLGRSAAYRNG